MATLSDAASPEIDGVDRRLHPMSWLFIVLQQLRAFALPLVIVIVTGRGNQSELAGLIGVAGIALAAVARYLTFRFRFGPDGVVIVSGVFQRTRRDIPYERIHDVLLHRSLLHRLFGVAEVRLESAGGKKSEGEMRVLSLSDAQAIEAIVRSRGAVSRDRVAGDAAAAEAEVLATPLLTLGTGEVVRLGLISNRGLVVVAAIFGAIAQSMPAGREEWQAAWQFVSDHPAPPAWLAGPTGIALAVVVAALVVLAALRVLSVALAVLQFHGFTLTEIGNQLRLERGLLTRLRHHVPTKRIQAWRIDETLLHRWFGRQSLKVDSAVNPGEGEAGTRDLVPLVTPGRMTELISAFLRRDSWPPHTWLPLHPRAWRRLLVRPSILIGIVGAIAVWRFGPIGLLVFGALPIVIVRARLWAAHAGYAEVDGGLIAVREGWLNRSWRFAEVGKLQTIQLTESPFDRRHGMATLRLDTAGTRSRDGALTIPFMPALEARALYDRLSLSIDRRPPA